VKERWTLRWFRRRALLYHLLVALIVPGCLTAADWQVRRAAEGNTLSYLYSVEWPIFAILAVWGWWQLIHEDPAHVESRKVERARRAATKGPFVPPPPDAPSGFLHPLQAASRPELVEEAARAEGRLPTRAAGSRQPAASGEASYEPAASGEASYEPVASGEASYEHSLSAYNAYLARLATGRTRKSWRNPHGVPQGRYVEPAGSGRRAPGAAVRADDDEDDCADHRDDEHDRERHPPVVESRAAYPGGHSSATPSRP
jgi:hypothetical protein